MSDKFCEEKYSVHGQRCLPKMVSEPAHTIWKGHSHEVGPGEPQLTEKQKWTRDNFDFLRDHIVRHLTAKSEFMIPRGLLPKPLQ